MNYYKKKVINYGSVRKKTETSRSTILLLLEDSASNPEIVTSTMSPKLNAFTILATYISTDIDEAIIKVPTNQN